MELLQTITQLYYKEIIFNIIKIAIQNIILEILQLKKPNLTINLKKKTISFKRNNYMVITYLIYQQSLIINKKQNREIIIRRKFISLTKNNIF